MTKAAHDKAEQILENSKNKAAAIRKSAMDYAEEVFDDLEDYYKENIDLIRENRARLHGKGSTAAPQRLEDEDESSIL